MDFDWNTVWTRGFPLSWVLSHTLSVSRSFLTIISHLLLFFFCSLFLSFLSCTVALFLFVSSFEKLTLKSQHLLSGVCIFPASFLFASFFPWPQPGALCLLKGNRIFRNDPLEIAGLIHWCFCQGEAHSTGLYPPHSTKLEVSITVKIYEKGNKKRVVHDPDWTVKCDKKRRSADIHFQKPCLKHLFILWLSLKH